MRCNTLTLRDSPELALWLPWLQNFMFLHVVFFFGVPLLFAKHRRPTCLVSILIVGSQFLQCRDWFVCMPSKTACMPVLVRFRFDLRFIGMLYVSLHGHVAFCAMLAPQLSWGGVHDITWSQIVMKTSDSL